MIIDSHAHLLPPERMAKLIRWIRRFSPDHPVPDAVTLDALLQEYRGADISGIWNFAHAIAPEETDSLNEWNWRLGQAHPWIIPFGTCHPMTPNPLVVIDRCLLEYRFVGMKFHPFIQRFTPWEPQWFPVYERIAAHGGIVVFHTGFEEFYGGSLPLAGFEAIPRTFPELTVVFAHANYPQVGEAFELLSRYPNLYLDTVNVFGSIARSWEPQANQRALEAELRQGLSTFPDRVTFGTDHPAGVGSLKEMYREVRDFGLPREIEQQLLGETARRLAERIRQRRR